LYMRQVTAIDPHWLIPLAPSLSTISKPLLMPPPMYNSKRDVIQCYVSVHYGKALWELPNALIDYPLDDTSIYRHVIRLLLRGSTIPSLAKYTMYLTIKADDLLKPTFHHMKAEALISKLKHHRIVNRSALIKQWKINPTFLKAEYLSLIQSQTHKHLELQTTWPPLKN
jgi:hypothetical protein